MAIKFIFKNEIIEFGVISVPYRKNRALFIARGANTDVLAYFTSEDNADIFNKALDTIIEMSNKALALPINERN